MDEAWVRISCGNGANGPRVYHWVAAKLPPIEEFDGDRPIHNRWVLARRSLARSEEIAYHLAYAPLDVTVADLVRVAGSRWAIEECFRAAKNECGLDQYAVRRYPGWYRHITLAMLAHAFLAAMVARALERGAGEMVRPPSFRSPRQKCGDSWTLSIPGSAGHGDLAGRWPGHSGEATNA
ncbi:hypothetical protein AB0H26_42395 [Streptomyces milbemycinicus]